MARDKDIQAKLEGYIIKCRKVEIKKVTKYETAQ